MKRFSFILLVLPSMLLSQNIVSSRMASLVNGDYTLVGDVYLDSLDNGEKQFRTGTNYLTQSGPDVQVFLTNDNNLTSPINLTNTQFIVDVGTGVGGVAHFSGAATFYVPPTVNLTDYDHIVFVCVQFGNLSWGGGSFGPPIPTNPVAGFAANSNNICIDQCIHFTDQSLGAITSWKWYFPGSTVPTTNAQNPNNVCYNTTGSYNVSLVVTNTSGQDSTFMLNYVTVNSLPTVTANASDTNICVGEPVILNGAGALNYSWDHSVMDGVSFMPGSTEVYIVTGTDGNNCQAVDSVQVTVNQVDVSTSLTADTIFSNAVSASYQWLDCGNGHVIIPGEIGRGYSPMTSGNYAVSVNQNGCLDTSVCVNFVITGLTDHSDLGIRLYPNPINDYLTVEVNNKTYFEIQLYDIKGRMLRSYNINDQITRLNLEDLNQGIYLIKLVGTENIGNLKVTKQ